MPTSMDTMLTMTAEDIERKGLPTEDDWDRKEVTIYSYDRNGTLLGYVVRAEERQTLWLQIGQALAISHSISNVLALGVFTFILWHDGWRVGLAVNRVREYLEAVTANLEYFMKELAEGEMASSGYSNPDNHAASQRCTLWLLTRIKRMHADKRKRRKKVLKRLFYHSRTLFKQMILFQMGSPRPGVSLARLRSQAHASVEQ